jgi:hypothetical protein
MKTQKQNIMIARAIWILCLLLQCLLVPGTIEIWNIGVELANLTLRIASVCIAAAIFTAILYSLYRIVTVRKWVKTINA